MPTFLDLEFLRSTEITQDTVIYLVRYIDKTRKEYFNIRAATPGFISKLKADPDTREKHFWTIENLLQDSNSARFKFCFPDGQLITRSLNRRDIEEYFPNILREKPETFPLASDDDSASDDASVQFITSTVNTHPPLQPQRENIIETNGISRRFLSGISYYFFSCPKLLLAACPRNTRIVPHMEGQPEGASHVQVGTQIVYQP